jgi:hypothetical protein
MGGCFFCGEPSVVIPGRHDYRHAIVDRRPCLGFHELVRIGRDDRVSNPYQTHDLCPLELCPAPALASTSTLGLCATADMSDTIDACQPAASHLHRVTGLYCPESA